MQRSTILHMLSTLYPQDIIADINKANKNMIDPAI